MTFDPTAVFLEEFDKAIAAEVEQSGFPVTQWFRNGVTKPENAVQTWKERGPECVRQFVRWFESSGEQVWITPDGIPAIELPLTVMFGEIEVKMVIDLITIGPLGLTIIDDKNGWKLPVGAQQLGIYACGVELAYGKAYRPAWGAWFWGRGTGKKDAKPDERTYFQPRIGLASYKYSVDFFTKELARFEDAVQRGIFTASVGEHCERCGVAYACLAVGGTEAGEYDPAFPGGAAALRAAA